MDYANPQALVSAAWLTRNLDAKGVKVVDATYFLPGANRDAKAEFAAQHIPGAVFFDIDDVCLNGSDLPHMLPDADTFSAKVSALGIANTDKVVVYDTNGGGMAAARVWWTFRVFSHDDVVLLNGGMKVWLAEGRPMTNEAPAPAPADYAGRKNDSLVRDIEQMLANVESGNEQVIDARTKERFEGTAPEPREGTRSGHIPGSLNLPFFQLMDNENNLAMRNADEIAAVFAGAGLDLDRPVIASCGSGVTASMLAFGLFLLGKEDVAVYDGSWSEWGMRQDTPIET
ncbi:MAG: 3-mercaptopyruvate sulfurtransferase [Rhodospirillales bacterium]|nr:3-mercaptopyruvate sulfurtransferase [Rhodospirillales bacterium]